MDTDVDENTVEGKKDALGQTADDSDENETPDLAIMPETEAEATGDFDDNPDALYWELSQVF